MFKYLTFRTGGAVLTALVISFVIGPSLIRWLRGQQANGQPIRNDGPETHLAKRGTPTMGGLMILVALIISTLLWADINNPYIWLVLGVTASFGLIGFVDDFLLYFYNVFGTTLICIWDFYDTFRNHPDFGLTLLGFGLIFGLIYPASIT